MIDPTYLPPVSRRRRQRRLPVLLLLSIAALLGSLLVLGLVLYQVVHVGSVYTGVRVLGVAIGGVDRETAFVRLQTAFAQRQGDTFILRDGNRRWSASRAELGLGYDAAATWQAAYTLGRQGPAWQQIAEQWRLLFQGQEIAPVPAGDPVITLSYLNHLAREIDQPMINAGLRFAGTEPQIAPDQVGRQLDTNATYQQLLRQVNGGEVALIVHSQPPAVTAADVIPALAAARTILQRPIAITYLDRSYTWHNGPQLQERQRLWSLSPQEMVEMITTGQEKTSEGRIRLTASLDPARLAEWVAGIAPEVEQPVREARFDFHPVTKTLSPTVISQEGRIVDIAATVRAILAASSQSDEGRRASLAVIVTRPIIAIEDAPRFGIQELIARAGESYFAGSSSNRAFNIQLGAKRLHGAVIPPGGVASFNAIVGPVSAESGYRPGYAIFGDYTLTDVGGGICQVATTAFRAAFWAGLEIVERTPHRYLLGYYELGGYPRGLDATVYEPTVDLKFKNTTQNYLLIQTEVDTTHNALRVYLYGTKPGWEVIASDPLIENVVAPGPPLPDATDPNLPAGTRLLVQSATPGMDVTITRTVRQGSQVLRTDTFKTHYLPARQQYVVGTKP